MKSEICIPHARVKDAYASLDFYERCLGFRKVSEALRPKQNEQTARRLLSAAAAVALVACLFVTGCASSHGGKSSGYAQARPTVLGDSIQPLRLKFNADKDKLRVLALFSPT
jgi:hypothetical protein